MKKRLDRVRARVRYKIGVALAVIAIVPLIGVAWFAGHEVLEADAERDRVGAVDASVRELVAMSELRTRLLDEGNWVSALRGIAELGLSSDITLTLTGIDVER